MLLLATATPVAARGHLIMPGGGITPQQDDVAALLSGDGTPREDHDRPFLHRASSRAGMTVQIPRKNIHITSARPVPREGKGGSRGKQLR